MYEKVNPSHPDKLADRIAGAMVDMAYAVEQDPRIAVEVLIGHGLCCIVYESSVQLSEDEIKSAVLRIAGDGPWDFTIDWNPQDSHLAANQDEGFRCGDNGIFKGCPKTDEQRKLSTIMKGLYKKHPSDGKAVIDGKNLTLCLSNVDWDDDKAVTNGFNSVKVNPLGYWTGGTDVDTGATNRKLGSDMGDAVTGGGLHGKDLSKADVTLNIVCHLLANDAGTKVEASCAIGDEDVTFCFGGTHRESHPYADAVEIARGYVDSIGGFEKLAEWGLI